ncbi:MAG: S-adenosylmethionine:tRNA ribosyltransferase-isomerase, partial [Ghiorsea sp.]|nr:S-adenosylmethionine:tRNA ribosyltransferase-isomerase [Ghiorsea sp.]
MQVSDFDFTLPEQLIAKQPFDKRDASRLLVLADNGFEDKHIPDLVGLVQKGDVWVVNDTKVIPARLMGKKTSGGKVEVLLLEPLGQDNVWSAWGKSNKPLITGMKIQFSDSFSGEVLKRS